MPLEIIRNDITKVKADAIVNPTNQFLDGAGGTDKAIHLAAGDELTKECRTLESLEVGEAKLTKGYNLPARYIIHTVGPIWKDGESDEDESLANCYKNSLILAKEYELESIAFPLIASGTYGYPKDRALDIAISTIGKFLFENEMMIHLVVYDKKSFKLSEGLFASIKEYIDDKYVEEHHTPEYEIRKVISRLEALQLEKIQVYNDMSLRKKEKRSLEDIVENMDESFSQMLLRIIDEQGKTDAEVYKKANIDRRLFSKIRNNIDYNSSKPTALAFAISLELNIDETKDLLLRAGYALSRSSKFDLIIEYFIENENYNIFEINEALFAFNQDLLGV